MTLFCPADFKAIKGNASPGFLLTFIPFSIGHFFPTS